MEGRIVAAEADTGAQIFGLSDATRGAGILIGEAGDGGSCAGVTAAVNRGDRMGNSPDIPLELVA
jgi:hypothetical protein